MCSSSDRKGIIAGGNWCVDHVKVIDGYPEETALGVILRESQSNGGGPYNLLKDLSKMGAAFPLIGVGLLGNDENGRYIRDDCRGSGIATEFLAVSEEGSTSYTDVLSVESTGRRTFFHRGGTNRLLGEEHFDVLQTEGRLFHLAYINLMESLEIVDENGETGAARVLKRAQAAGLKTSVDLVSIDRADFTDVVRPALPYVDTMMLNEFEAERLSGLSFGDGQDPDWDSLEAAAHSIVRMGVREWVVIHCPVGVLAAGRDGLTVKKGSVMVPEEEIVGTVGAGDAFAAGLLYGLHESWDFEQCLELGICVAASCLYHVTTSGGILPIEDCLALGRKYGFRKIP